MKMITNLDYFVVAIFLVSGCLLFIGLMLLKPKEKQKSEGLPASITSVPKQWFQINETITLQEQEVNIYYKDGKHLTLYIRECAVIHDFYGGDRPNRYRYKYALKNIQNDILSTLNNNGYYTFDADSDYPHIVSMKDVFQIRYEGPNEYATDETVTWIEEE